MKKLSVMALVLSLCTAAAVNAATVTYTLDLSAAQGAPGTFTLRAKSSAGDNAGIAAYSVQLTGALTVNHNSLRAASVEDAALNEGSAGFTLLRSADNSGTVALRTISASQDTIAPTPHLIYGMGQTAGSLAGLGLTGAAPEGNPWAADMVIATGTYAYTGTPQDPGISYAPLGALSFSNAYNSDQTGNNRGTATQATLVRNTIGVVPEPATLALAGMGLIGMVGAARRRKA